MSDLSLVVGPRSKFQEALLLIERKEGYVDFTRAPESCRRRPEDQTSVVDHGVCRHVTDRKVVCAVSRDPIGSEWSRRQVRGQDIERDKQTECDRYRWDKFTKIPLNFTVCSFFQNAR